jgi:putative transposase
MAQPTFTSVQAAYQLHFYLCFKTSRLQPRFSDRTVRELLDEVAADVCGREQYHLLESQTSPDHLRLLISTRPDQSVSRAVKMLKGNLSRALGLRFPPSEPWLARGYFARSSGKADIETVRSYVASQVSHHRYRGSWTEPLQLVNRSFMSPAFQLPHSVTLLNYHLVLVTKGRAGVFDETIAPRLFKYITAVGAKHGFQVERMSLLPDHLHLMFEAIPGVSVGDLALALMNNTAHWMARHYWGVLKQTDAWDLWQPSYYVGTVGEYTTAHVKRFLGQN